MDIHKREQGFGHLWLLLVVVVVAIAGVGFLVWERREDTDDGGEAVYTAAPEKTCDGDWYDTHVHLDEIDLSRTVANRMREGGIGCSLMFTQVDINQPDISILGLREEFSPNPGRFVLFADVIEDVPGDVTRAKLDKLLSQNPDTFKGFGEFPFYREPLKGTSLRAEPWPTIFQFAADKDMFVMLHVTGAQEADLEYMLASYPDTKVLIHHRELLGSLPALLKKYKNLYHTLDTTNLTTVINQGGNPPENVLFYPQGEGDAAGFLSQLNANRASLLDRAVTDWTPVIAAAPDRIFWGTDVSIEWHTEKQVYDAILKFSKDFVARLPAEHREGYMRGNALKAFGKGITLSELTDDEINLLDSQGDGDEDVDDGQN